MPSPPDPTPLIELATAYWGSATLIAAVRLGVFSKLAGGPLEAGALAAAVDADANATDALLAGLVSLGLVETTDAGFVNRPLAEAFLVEGRPGYLGPALLYNGDIYPLWGRLDEVVKSGHVAQSPDQYLGADAARTRNFVFGMHHRALGIGQAVIGAIDLSGRTRLADVGGGPGTYAALLTAQSPSLTADVLDLPPVAAIAAQIVADMGAAERVRCRAFDYYTDPLPDRYDAALISGVLHREQPDGVRALLAKVAAAIEPGGVLYISDVMLDDDRAGPLFSTMFALNMRVLAHDGRCHSVAEQRGWLEETGFDVTDVTRLPPPVNYTVIRAERRA